MQLSFLIVHKHVRNFSSIISRGVVVNASFSKIIEIFQEIIPPDLPIMVNLWAYILVIHSNNFFHRMI